MSAAGTGKPIALTEKPSQARNVQAALGDKFAKVLPAQGHLLRLQEPDEFNPDWAGEWGYQLLWNGTFFPWVPDDGDGKPPRLAEIRNALKTAPCVYVGTDCDREGQAIADSCLRMLGYKGPVKRMIFNKEDPAALRKAFADAVDNRDYHNLFEAAYARHQADMVYGMTLTRAATIAFKRGGGHSSLGVGRVKTPTVAIVVRRELEIRNFRRSFYFGVAVDVQTRNAPARSVRLRYLPKGEQAISDQGFADGLAEQVRSYNGPVSVETKPGREGPPRFHDQASLQKTAGAWGWSADKTAKVLQQLYQDAKLLTYPGTDGRYLPDEYANEAQTMLAGLKAMGFGPMPDKPVIRSGKTGHFWTEGLDGKSHYAIVPNVNVVQSAEGAQVHAGLDPDARKLFDHVACLYVAALLPDHEFNSTSIWFDFERDGKSFRFSASGRTPLKPGWKAALDRRELDNGDEAEDEQPIDSEGRESRMPAITNGELVDATGSETTKHQTEPKKRLKEGDLIELMKNAWKTVPKGPDRDRLEKSEGIGRPRTRPPTIKELIRQGQLGLQGLYLVPSDECIGFIQLLDDICPAMTSPVMTARWEMRLDDIEAGRATKDEVLDEISKETARLLEIIRQNAGKVEFRGPVKKPTKAMLDAVAAISKAKNLKPGRDVFRDFDAARQWLDENATKHDPASGPRPAQPAQIEFAKKLSAETGEAIPAKAMESAKALSEWIDAAKKKQPPNQKQLDFAKRLSSETGRNLTAQELASAQKLSKAIDEMMRTRRKAAGGGTGTQAPAQSRSKSKTKSRAKKA